MTETPFQWRDPSHPVYLHYNHEKFWEIKFNDSQRIQVRYGKLNNDGTEGSSEVHLIKKDTVEHAQDLVTTKLKKGYQIVQKEKSMKSKQPNNVMQIEESLDDVILDSSQLRPSSQSQRETSSLKRRTSENLLHEDRKKVHMNELLQEEKAEQKNIMNSITSSLFGKKNGEQQQQQTSLFRNNHQEEHKEKIPETILIEEDDDFPKSYNNNNNNKAQEIPPSSRFDPFSFTDSGSEHSKKSDESIYDRFKYQKKFVSKNNSKANSEISNRAVVNKEQPKPAQNKLSQEINNKSNRLDPMIFEENSYLLKPDSHSTFNTKSKPSSRSPTENNEITPMQVEESLSQSQPQSLEMNTFQGDYLTKVINRKLQYCKVQVLYKYVKVEHAVVGNPRPTDVQLLTYKNTAAAEAMARQIIFNKTLSGYEPRSEKFVYDFKLAELGIKDISSIKTIKSKPIQQVNKPKIDVKQLLNEEKEDKEVWESPMYELEVEDSLALFAKSNKQKPRTPVRDTPARRDPGLLYDVYDYDDINDENFSPDYGVDEPDEEYTRKEGKKSRPKQQKNSLSPERRELSTTTSRKHTLGEHVKDYQALMEPSLWSKQNVKGWYLSEKLEGVRCFWSGEDLWNSVSKMIILTPAFFTKDFPKSPLEGILWPGKGRMKELVTALKRQIPDQHEWKGLVFKVVDAPMLKEPYKTRYEKMKVVFGEIKSQYISLHKQSVYKGEEDMKKIEDRLESEAILGVVLKDPNSYYEKGKSKSLLKLDKNDLLMKDIGSKLLK